MANSVQPDIAVYSILPHEWPAIRTKLEWQLTKPRI